MVPDCVFFFARSLANLAFMAAFPELATSSAKFSRNTSFVSDRTASD